jgi:PmbA protein
MLFVGDSESSCRRDFVKLDDLADKVIWQLEMAKGKATVSTKLLSIIFTPHGVASCLLSPLVLAFNGKSVFEGGFTFKR